MNNVKFSRTVFFKRKSPVLLLCLLEREEGKRGPKERGEIFQMKEGKNISSDFYLYVLVLVTTDMQIQL